MAAPAKVVIAGLDPQMASELSGALGQLAVEVAGEDFTEPTAGFCSLEALEQFRLTHPGVPVVVVGTARRASEWLDAIESGAQDYCFAPFDPGLIGWILAAVSRPFVPRAA